MLGSYPDLQLRDEIYRVGSRPEDLLSVLRPAAAATWPAEIGPIRRAYAVGVRRRNRLRAVCNFVGTVLVVIGLSGLLLLAAGPIYAAAVGFLAPQTQVRPAAPPLPGSGSGRTLTADFLDLTLAPPGRRDAAAQVRATPDNLPITELSIPSIGLASKVVPAGLINRAGQVTWEVPPFVVGHAEGTAGAGAPGNAVLMGHITSRNLGNVFINLDKVQVGDMLAVFSGDRQFNYRVVEVKAVPRTDVSVVGPTDKPTVTLITCTGTWLPLISDYSHRLVVRAELVGR